ncbi:MAG: nucleotidyltransferase family protein [Clostridia bacterium]|nr:nucleotidyltransferase family protein [Clostridia bacterium]
MRTAAIVAEYNPFHNGHAHHLRMTREAGFDAVFAVMSGNFVQRGEPAAFSKWARAEAAVRCGVDLVLELPVYWAASSAQQFARGAVSIIRHTGVADVLSFGSECGDADRIRKTADLLRSLLISPQLLRSGSSFAAAREAAVRVMDNDAAELLRTPNDTLAVEYVQAARHCGLDAALLAVPRIGAHDGDPFDAFSSASYIRSNLSRQIIENYCPQTSAQILLREIAAGKAPADLRLLEREILLRLRTISAEQLASVPDISEGLENRILACARSASSLEELADSIKTKRYPLARIRRILLGVLLGTDRAQIPPDVPYLRVLAIGRRGAELLRAMKKKADLPIVSKMTQIESLGEAAVHTFRAECLAGEVYALLQPQAHPAGAEWTSPITVL